MIELGPLEGQSRILDNQQLALLKRDVLREALYNERWSDKAQSREAEVEAFIDRSLTMLQSFEERARPHPQIHPDTDAIYVVSGPGPFSNSKNRLKKPDSSFKVVTDSKGHKHKVYLDFQYHNMRVTREMDRDRLRAAYAIASIVTEARVEVATGHHKPTNTLSWRDYAKYGPYLLYAGADYQIKHIEYIIRYLRRNGQFHIPNKNLIIGNEFTDENTGLPKKVVHTGDQIDGLRFPLRPDGSPPRRVVMVDHSAHFIRVLHIKKFPSRIPDGTILQLFPVPTRYGSEGVIEYAKAELLGTLAAVFKNGTADLIPYDNYQL